MNSWVKVVIGAGLLILTACAKNKSGSGSNPANQNIAVTPTSDCLLNRNSYNGTQCNHPYGQYSNFGNYQMDPHQVANYYAQGFCGCNGGYRPVYQNSWGLGCVNSAYTTGNYISYTWGYSNGQWLNNPQIQTTTPTTGNCYADAMIACDPTVVNSCGMNGQCMAVGGSRLGVCQYNQNYQPTNPYYNNGYYGGGYYGGGVYGGFGW